MSTTSNFNIAKLTVGSIEELNSTGTLYVVDFRATGESLEHEIHSMFTYENLSQWLCSTDDDKPKGVYLVNTAHLQRSDISASNLVIAEPASKPSLSIMQRAGSIPGGVSRVWAGIPHPSIDAYAHTSGITLNYQYSDFLLYNNKLSQKELLGDFSPEYFEIKDKADLEKALELKTGYIKASLGAGGFSVFSVSEHAEKIRAKSDAILASETPWYYEATATGKPYSVQIYKNKGNYTLFGYAQQYIEGTNYIGAKLLDIDDLGDDLTKFLQETCERVDPLIRDYDGFFGIDIMVDKDVVSVLELNMRLTATTIPTLLANNTGTHASIEYFEEVSSSAIEENDIVLTTSPDAGEACILRISDSPNECIGKNSYIQLVGCEYLPPSLNAENISRVRTIVERNVSAAVSTQVKNFWPYGWTLSFVLAESHCVLSSWHLQQNIFIDIFCCTDINTDQLIIDLCDMFGGSASVVETKDRYVS